MKKELAGAGSVGGCGTYSAIFIFCVDEAKVRLMGL
jgi:hypothetical protein